jgi:TolB protein
MVAYTGLDENGNVQVFVMNAEGSNARQLTHGLGGARSPRWSHDNSHIAYERDTSDTSQIFVVPVTGAGDVFASGQPLGASTMVTREPEGAVDPGGWTPDGGSIVFSTLDISIDHYSAVSLDLASRQTRVIVADGSLPMLSPDGAWIAFNSYLKPQVRLILADSDGSQRRTIARSGHNDAFQSWSPDSTRIAFFSTTEADGPGTYVYNLTTGETHFATAGRIECWVDNDHILVS